MFLRVAAGMETRGWRSVAVVNRDAWLAERLREAGLEPIILDSKGSINLSYLGQLAGIVRKHRVDVILTHLYGSAIYGALGGKLTRRPVISVLHGQSDIDANGRLAWLKSRIVTLGASRLVSVSGPLRDKLALHLPAPRDCWAVIPNGVDTAVITPGGTCGLRKRLSVSPETLLVGALGNIRKPKAYDVFLRTAALLAARPDRYRFVIGGDGSGTLMEELLALRNKLGLDKIVHFAGMQSDIRGYLGELDIFLSTSSTEGFSIACVEAMACGLPVVATRSGGPEEILIDGETGFFADVGDVEGLASAVATLAADPLLRGQLGEAGRARAEKHFSLDSMLDAYDHLLQQLISR